MVFSPTWPGYEASVNLRWSRKVYTSPNVSTSVYSPAPIPSSINVVDTKACSVRSNQNFNSACKNDFNFSLIWLWVCYLTWKVMHIIGVTYFTFRRCVLLWLHMSFKHPSLLGRTPLVEHTLVMNKGIAKEMWPWACDSDIWSWVPSWGCHSSIIKSP